MRNLSKMFVLVALLGVGATSASAQQPRDLPSETIMTTDNRDSGTSWGWLGLVGLAGLAGMMRRESHARNVAQQPLTSSR